MIWDVIFVFMEFLYFLNGILVGAVPEEWSKRRPHNALHKHIFFLEGQHTTIGCDTIEEGSPQNFSGDGLKCRVDGQ